MSKDYRHRISDLSAQAGRLGRTPVRLALEEEAVRIADTHQDVDQGFSLRKNLIETATFTGYPEKALVAFTWMLAQCDKEPERYHEAQLMWQYKWILGSLDRFPQITLRQMEDAFADMENRYRRCGLSLKPLWKERTDKALSRGDVAEARAHYRRWSRTGRDFGSDCAACDRDFQVSYLLQTGRAALGIKCAQPLVEGRQRCATVPHTSYGKLLLPLLRRGDIELAQEYHHAGYRLVQGNRNYVRSQANHLTFLVVTGNRSAALDLLEKHLTFALEIMELSKQFEFYLAALFLLKQCAAAGKTNVKLRLPAQFPLHREDGRYEVTSLLDWFEAQCRDLAARFDARNGTDYFARRLALPDGDWKDLAATVDGVEGVER